MTDESTNLETEVEATETEVENDQPELEANTEQPEQEAPEADEEEVEYEGAKYKLPRELKDALMRNADYTRKTQEIASQKKLVEDEKLNVQKQAQAFQQDMQKHVALHALDEQLKAFERIDWNTYFQQDPVAATALKNERDELRWKQQELRGEISKGEHQRRLQHEHNMSRLMEETRQTLAREIKNWSPEYESNLSKYGKDSGFNDQELASLKYDARQARILNKAYLYDQMLKKAEQKPPLLPAKPTKTIGKVNPASKGLSDELSAEEWVKRRNAQVRK